MRDFSRIAALVVLVLLVVVLASRGPSFGIGFLDAPTLRVLAVVALVLFVTRRGGFCCTAAAGEPDEAEA